MVKDVTTSVISTNITDAAAMAYMKEVAFGFETGGASEVIRKYVNDVYVKVHACNGSGVTSDINASDFAEVASVVTELNSLIKEIDIKLINTSATNICESETHGLYSSGDCYTAGVPAPNINVWITTRGRWETISGQSSGAADGLGGQFLVNYNSSGEMTHGRCWIRDSEPASNRKSWIREEITQALGLGKDSESYSDSIFYETSEDGGFATSFSELDKKIIQMVYDPRVKTGMNAAEVEKALASPSTFISGRSWSFSGSTAKELTHRNSQENLDERFVESVSPRYGG